MGLIQRVPLIGWFILIIHSDALFCRAITQRPRLPEAEDLRLHKSYLGILKLAEWRIFLGCFEKSQNLCICQPIELKYRHAKIDDRDKTRKSL